jgi:hypothetical protein
MEYSTHLYPNPTGWRCIRYKVKNKVANILKSVKISGVLYYKFKQQSSYIDANSFTSLENLPLAIQELGRLCLHK